VWEPWLPRNGDNEMMTMGFEFANGLMIGLVIGLVIGMFIATIAEPGGYN